LTLCRKKWQKVVRRKLDILGGSNCTQSGDWKWVHFNRMRIHPRIQNHACAFSVTIPHALSIRTEEDPLGRGLSTDERDALVESLPGNPPAARHFV
jgi:hypothetical protein